MKVHQDQVFGKHILRNNPGGRQDPQSDGQVKTGSLFFDVRRCQINRNSVSGKSITGIVNCRFDALFAFFNCSLRQPDRCEGRQAGCDVHLHFNPVGIDSQNSTAENFCKQDLLPYSRF